jgi:hypothetical protein
VTTEDESLAFIAELGDAQSRPLVEREDGKEDGLGGTGTGFYFYFQFFLGSTL